MSDRNFDSKTEKPSGTGTQIGSLTDLGLGLIDSAIAKPYNATIGLVAPKIDLSNDYNHNSIAAKVGDFGGGIADVLALSKVAGWGVGKGLGLGAERGLISARLAESATLASTLSLGTTGALYGGVFTSGSASERLKNAAVGFTTFGTLGASTAGLSKFGFLGEAGSRTFMQNVALGGLSGIPAGIANAEATSLVNGNGLSFSPSTVGKSALYYGLFGATMGGVAHGLTEGGVRVKNWLSTDVSASEMAGARLGAPSEFETVEPRNASQPVAGDRVAVPKPPSAFNIPETGNIDLGRLMKETPPADQIQMLQEVFTGRPKVPVGSWMRLIEPEDMPQFLRAIDQSFPDTALNTAKYLIDSQNLRPPTADSPPIDFAAWERALDTVKAEKLVPAQAANVSEVVPTQANPDPSEAVPELGKTAEKPFTYDDVTMSVRDADQLKLAITTNAQSELGTKVLNYANSWATIMEQKIAAGEPLTPEMARQASLETGLDPRNYEYDIARTVLIDTWQHGAELDRALPVTSLQEAVAAKNIADAIDTADGAATRLNLNAQQQGELNNFGSIMQSVARSRADAINMVRGMDPANIDSAVRTGLLDHLVGSQTFLRLMGVDSAESTQSIVQAMRNVPVQEIPRFVHYADQFHHDAFPNSVMSGMDQAVANGNIPPGTQQAWIDAISAKMRIVFPGIRESEWAISKPSQ